MNISKIKKKFKKLPRFLAEHIFGFFLILLIFALILGGILFYKYSILPEITESEFFGKNIKLEENVLEGILIEWEDNKEKFEAIKTKEYPNLFSVPSFEELID